MPGNVYLARHMIIRYFFFSFLLCLVLEDITVCFGNLFVLFKMAAAFLSVAVFAPNWTRHERKPERNYYLTPNEPWVRLRSLII